MTDRKHLFVRLSMLILFIFGLNSVATYFNWYTSIWWFDMLMHFLGGFWLGLLALWFTPAESIKNINIFYVIVAVFVLGGAWEVYEIIVNNTFAKDIFDLQDTFSDLCFDLSGGSASVLYFISKAMKVPRFAV